MCGICGIVSTGPAARPGPAAANDRAGCGIAGPDGNGCFRDRQRRARPRPPGDHRHGWRRAAAVQRGRDALDHLQRRDLQLRRAARGAARARPPLPHGERHRGRRCTPGRSGARRASPASTASGHWRLWDRRSERAGALPRPAGSPAAVLHRARPAVCVRVARSRRSSPTPRSAARFDPAGLAETFTYWSTVAPRTVFRGVEQLRAGPRRRPRPPTACARRAYWRSPSRTRAEEPARTWRQRRVALRETLVEATRLRFLRSDVPVGAYLSGGIDSLGHRRGGRAVHRRPLHTFSLRFADAEFDEGRLPAARWSRGWAREHQESSCRRGATSREVFPEVVRHAETPDPPRRPGAAVPAVAAGARQRLQGRA